MFPWVLGLLITLKLKNLDLYRKLVQGSCRASEVIDYIDGALPKQTLNGRLRYELNSDGGDIYTLAEYIAMQSSGSEANALGVS